MKAIRKISNLLLVPIIVGIDTLLVRLNIIKPKVVIYVDGGLCSQMRMWAQGEYYAEKGYEVYYDLDWYKTSAKGIDGTSERKMELHILWPNLDIQTLSPRMTWFFRKFLLWEPMSSVLPEASEIRRSVYFFSYSGISFGDMHRIFSKFFQYDLAVKTVKMKLDNTKRYCGVHVRRGDLTNIALPAYPRVADGYFIRAIEYVQKHEIINEFLLFSEDSQWLRDNILPNVSVPCRIIEGNTGYEDLMLLAQCQIVIASQGSFGPTAALINPNCELLIRNKKPTKDLHAKRELYIQ